MKIRRLAEMGSLPEADAAVPDPIESALFAADLGGQAPELDLHGLPPEQALDELRAFVNHEFADPPRLEIKIIKIIHGRGTGRLQRQAEEYLRAEPVVLRFRGSQAPGQANAVTLAALAPNKK